MTVSQLAIAFTLLVTPRLDAQLWEVFKSVDIDAGVQSLQAPQTLYRGADFTVSLHAPPPGTVLTDDSAGQILYIRRGSSVMRIGIERQEVGTGDVVTIARTQPARIESGQIAYVAIRILPLGPVPSPPSFRVRPDILRASEVAAAAATGGNLSGWRGLGPNYGSIYLPCNPDCGPWHSHDNAAQIYLVQSGTAIGELGGSLQGAAPSGPATVIGTGAVDFRSYQLSRGDIVIIPPNTPHHVNLNAGKFSYVIVQINVR